MTEYFMNIWNQFCAFATSHLLPAIILLVVGILVVKILNRIVAKFMDKVNFDPAVERLAQTLIRVMLYLLLGLIVASAVGIDVTGVVALASVLTLAVSLALQDAISNTIGGFTLLSTKPFVTGDFVEISGQTGTVTDVGLTYTKIVTPENKVVSMPNKSVVADKIINYTALGTRRVEVNVSASYDAPTETVLKALLKAAQLPEVLEEPAPFVGLTSYGDSAINYTLRVWCKNEHFVHVLFTVNQNVRTCFEEMDVEMTYPHLNVHVDR